MNIVNSYSYSTDVLDTSFKFTVNVTDEFNIPAIRAGGTYSYNVDWGDGNTETGIGSGNKLHTYASSGSYQISITGLFSGLVFNNAGDKTLITSVDQWGDVGLSLNQSNAFYGCTNLVSFPEDGGEFLNSLTDITQILRGCTSFTSFPTGTTFENAVEGHQEISL